MKKVQTTLTVINHRDINTFNKKGTSVLFFISKKVRVVYYKYKTIMKIKFVSNSPLERYDGCTINPSFLFLKTFYDLKGLSDITWLPWDAIMMDDEHTQINEIIEEAPDLLCLAMFIWNDDRHYRMIDAIKKALPNTIILVGGPQLRAHKDPEFFNKHPNIDYVCYGDGEDAFRRLVDFLTGKEIVKNFVNICENNNGENIIWPYELFKDEEYWSVSPYLTNKELLDETYSRLGNKGINLTSVRLCVEFARGCMYKCSFCDWAQNLNKKVTRRTHDWKADIDYFFEKGWRINETDANFGQFKEDIEIFDYAMALYKSDPTRGFRLEIANTSKLKKDATYHIMLNQAKYYDLYPVILSIQDPNPDVLRNIDRPDVSYAVYVDMVRRFKEDLPSEKHGSIAWVHLIIGLCSQTYSVFMNGVKKMIEDGFNAGLLELQYWSYLENAPSAELDFQIKWKQKWAKMYAISHDSRKDETLWQGSLEDVYERISKGLHNHIGIFESKILIGSSTMNPNEVFAIKNFEKNVRQFQYEEDKWLNTNNYPNDFDEQFNKLVQASMDEANEFWNQNETLFNKYGFLVLAYKQNNEFNHIPY